MIYHCCDERRRAEMRRLAQVAAAASPPTPLPPNGIDFVEVADLGPGPGQGQRRLRLTFVVADLTPTLAALTAANVRIRGGERIPDVRVTSAAVVAGVLEVEVAQAGDFSIYTLELTTPDGGPLADLDPLLSSVDFSFKIDCPVGFDCVAEAPCDPEPLEEPEIDYLARDYASFRQLLLDRMALLTPGWTERNPADQRVALIELLAYVGDQLSYRQDAVATEAYLGTARERVSVRRHARLLDYALDDGCNARTWVHLALAEPASVLEPRDIVLAAGTPLVTAQPGEAVAIKSTFDLARAVDTGAEVFETMHDVTLRPDLGELVFYAWGERDCCLPAGSTKATLDGDVMGDPAEPRLRPGDLLLLEEVLGPATGRPADADPRHRHVVRLVSVKVATDPLYDRPITGIEWGLDDALPFPLCISSTTDPAHRSVYVEGVSVARGNVVLADHGRTIREDLPDVPRGGFATPLHPGGHCDDRQPAVTPARYRPHLLDGPLTHAARVRGTPAVGDTCRRSYFDPAASAVAAFRWTTEDVLPVIELDDGSGFTWCPQRDLLSSDPFAREFVAEIDNAGSAVLRFGDDVYGQRPAGGTAVTATYRVGNGTRGNVGAGALRHVVRDGGQRILSVRNPLPATGGSDPEPLERVRQHAPVAFRTPDRAVTPDDYAAMARRYREVQDAQATARRTGSWRTIFLSVDRAGGRPVDAGFEAALRDHLERFRMAGHDLEIDGPRFVPLEVGLRVCVDDGYYRADVAVALGDVLGSRRRADGQLGEFYPDRYTFGQPVYLSRLYAAAQGVQGVQSVEVRTLQRLGRPSTAALKSGSLDIGRLEIAQLQGDPNFPERGLLHLDLVGGR